MEANLHTPQVPPGDANQFMHAAFASKEEMLNFYLIMNRFVNPVTYFMQRTDKERLEDLLITLGQYAHSLSPFEAQQFLGVGPLIPGFALYMLKENVPKKKRINKAEDVASFVQFITLIAAGMNSIKEMIRSLHSHIQNVKFLIDNIEKEEQSDTPTGDIAH